MPLSFFAYIDESTDDYYPASTVMKVSQELSEKGDRCTLKSGNGSCIIIGLGGISYEDGADLHRQVCIILKGLDV